MDLNQKIEARRKELAEEAARAREEERLLRRAKEEAVEKEAADRLKQMGVELDDDVDLEPEIDDKMEELIARQARKNIPASEWIALVILSFFALMVASGTLIGGLICAAVIWSGYKHTFEKQKRLITKKMSEREAEV